MQWGLGLAVVQLRERMRWRQLELAEQIQNNAARPGGAFKPSGAMIS